MGPWRLGRGDLLGPSSRQTNPTSQSRDRRPAPRQPRRQPPGWLGSLPGPRVQKSAWQGLSGGGTGTGPLPVLPGWRAGRRAASNGQRPVSLGPSSGREEGLQPVALLPRAPQGRARGAGFFWGWLATSVPPPGQGGWASGWRSFSSQYGEGGGSTDEGSAGLWLEERRQSQVRGALGLGVARPACGSPWHCRPCRESWWGRRALLLLLVAGRV